MIDTTRIKTYSPGDLVTATELNAIQDRLADTTNLTNRLATLSTAESVWVDRSLQDGDASATTVAVDGFVKLQVGGQRGMLMLPGVPDGLALERVLIRCHIPDNDVAFGLWQSIASEADGLSITRTQSQVPDWPTVTASGDGWGTLTLAGPPIQPRADTTLWVLVENRHATDELNALLLSSIQGLWGTS